MTEKAQSESGMIPGQLVTEKLLDEYPHLRAALQIGEIVIFPGAKQHTNSNTEAEAAATQDA